jgi:hypothetical protein
MYREKAEPLLRLLCLVIIGFCCASNFADGEGVAARAEVLCTEPPFNSLDSWMPDSTVTVKIDAAWEAEARDSFVGRQLEVERQPGVLRGHFQRL